MNGPQSALTMLVTMVKASHRRFMLRGIHLFAVACAAALAACADSGETIAPVASGYVVGDEPYAAQAGASVLAEGGNAVDAATATYFALSVSYPVAAGLGGGGLCIVHDTGEGAQDEAFVFLPRDAAGKGAFAVPGNVRGFAALQAAHGRLPWQRDVAAAEQMATTGFPVSTALAARLAATQDVIRLDANLSAEFLDESGHAKQAGDRAINLELGRTIGLVRATGSAGLYRGTIADAIATYTAAQGGAITQAELDASVAQRAGPDRVALGDAIALLPPRRVGSGAFAASLIKDVENVSAQPGEANMARSLALATARSLDTFGVKTLPTDLGSTGFAAVDNSGQAVACAVTMDGPFGSGHTVDNTGITLARAPSGTAAGLAPAFLTPLIALKGDSLALAGAGSGGPNGTASIVYSLLNIATTDTVSPDFVRTTGVAPYDTVNAILCQNNTCAALADPGAHGLGKAVGQ